MNLKHIKFNFYSKLNRDRKHWPVTVWKKVRRGEDWDWETDRARRVKNPETGEWEYEFLKDSVVTDAISYKHVQNGPNGHPLVVVAKPEKEVVMPVSETMELEESQNGPDEVDMDWVMDQAHFIKVGMNELERSYDIVQTDESAWWQEDKLQAAFLFVGAGIFFMLLGISYSKVISKTAVETLNKIASSMLPVAGMWLKGELKN